MALLAQRRGEKWVLALEMRVGCWIFCVWGVAWKTLWLRNTSGGRWSAPRFLIQVLRNRAGRSIRGGGILRTRGSWREAHPRLLLPSTSEAHKACAQDLAGVLGDRDRIRHDLLRSLRRSPRFTELGAVDHVAGGAGRADRSVCEAVTCTFADPGRRSGRLAPGALPRRALGCCGACALRGGRHTGKTSLPMPPDVSGALGEEFFDGGAGVD